MKRTLLILGLLGTVTLLSGSTFDRRAASALTTYHGDLYDDQQGQLDLTLSGGVEYQYDGVCDNSCSDLDFELHRWNGTRWIMVAEDKGYDDTPTVVVAPRRNTVYRLVIIMASCASAGQCHYDVDVF
jgi:hypothetical protein